MSARGWLLRIVAGGSLVRDIERVLAEHEVHRPVRPVDRWRVLAVHLRREGPAMSAFELRQLPPPGGPVVARESLQRAIAARPCWRSDKVDTMVVPVWPELPL